MFAPDGTDSQKMCINVSLNFDEIVEGEEEFELVIDSTDNAVLITRSTAVVTIQDLSSKLDGSVLLPV